MDNNKDLAAAYDVSQKFLEILGLPKERCTRFNLRIEAGQPVAVDVTYYVEKGQLAEFEETVTSGYKLVPRSQQIAIWDIDNCLADDRHRVHLIDWDRQGDERYQRYNEEMRNDPVAHLAGFRETCERARPVFFTGRPEMFRATTTEWIQEKLGVECPELHMRPNGTFGITPAMLKMRMLENLWEATRNDPVEIVAAFDDIPAVIQMYRSFGIPAIQLQVAEPVAYEPSDLVWDPQTLSGVTR